MNNSKNVPAVSTATMMAQIATDVKVGMEDVVSVFLSRYENSLHDLRTTKQAEMAELNKQIKTLTDAELKRATDLVKQAIVTTQDIGLVILEQKLDGDVVIEWSKKVLNFNLATTVRSKSVTGDAYRSKTSGTVGGQVEIDSNVQKQYQELIEKKQKIADELTVINNNLRDMSRKERQVKGQIAEMKLSSCGMEQLLQEPTLLALIDDPLKS